MYSYEDCMRAVQLYIKLGKRANDTIRLLGYARESEINAEASVLTESADGKTKSEYLVDQLKAMKTN